MVGSQRDDRVAANKPGVTGEIGLVRRILSRGWVGQPINGTADGDGRDNVVVVVVVGDDGDVSDVDGVW